MGLSSLRRLVTAGSARGAASSAVVGGSIALLDAKRANNLAIILSCLKLPFDEIRKAVVDLDVEILSTDAVRALQSVS